MDYKAPKNDVSAENTTIETYLNALCAPLGNLPAEAREEIRQEIGAHLQSLVTMKREPQRVLESALQQFGDPSEIGRLLALEWENRAWDLSGLSILQRIEKVCDASAQVAAQNDWQKEIFTKRARWVKPLTALPFLLFLAKSSLSDESLALIRVLDIATVFACGLALIVSWTLAWLDWHHPRAQEKSPISRIRLVLSQIGIGLSSLMPLIFSPRIIFPQLTMTILSHFTPILAALTVGLTVLVVVWSAFEPSRKVKSVVRAELVVGGLCGVLFFHLPMMVFSRFGVASVWVVLPIMFLLSHAFSRWWKRQPAKSRQKAE